MLVRTVVILQSHLSASHQVSHRRTACDEAHHSAKFSTITCFVESDENLHDKFQRTCSVFRQLNDLVDLVNKNLFPQVWNVEPRQTYTCLLSISRGQDSQPPTNFPKDPAKPCSKQRTQFLRRNCDPGNVPAHDKIFHSFLWGCASASFSMRCMLGQSPKRVNWFRTGREANGPLILS